MGRQTHIRKIGRRYFLSAYQDLPPEYGRIRLAVAIFMAVKGHAVMAKLSGDSTAANLNVIKRAVSPGGGWSSDWEHDNKETFEITERALLLKRVRTDVRTYGYGDDIAYELTEQGISMVREYREDRSIAWAIEEALMLSVYGRTHRDFDCFTY